MNDSPKDSLNDSPNDEGTGHDGGTGNDGERDRLLAAAVGLREQGRQEEARDRLTELAARHPDDVEVAYQTAWAHDVLGLEAEAVPYYERALKTTGAEPGLSEEDRRGALLGLGSTFRVLGRYEEAVATLRGGVEEFPDDGALRTFLAMALFNTGDHHESTRLLLRLVAATSEDPRVGRYRRAIEYYAEDLDETV
ncbi:tetratricopeptide repeat protein [Streptomyces sp. Je 1-79]|uniref:tetratricopeptide repeat protein n=1 Tax=Streptomyces sp. Je 1-79 TaxID=2943847 RepID=UPI0021A45121|nr:tetratricopeptide repeat protein [Streptomyces sp. Je 1-79]MCT4351924.1 tetratricopeptide repeat protein [Streptomyces sp. Je 1-79]